MELPMKLLWSILFVVSPLFANTSDAQVSDQLLHNGLGMNIGRYNPRGNIRNETLRNLRGAHRF